MSLVRYTSILLKGAALWAALATMVLVLVLAAFGFLAAACFIWLAAHLGAAAAAALSAVALLLLALIVSLSGGIMLALLRARAPELFESTAGSIATIAGLLSLLVRQDPRRTLLLALLAGALTEYFAAPEKPRG